MEDIASKLTEILKDPNIMNQLRSFVGSSPEGDTSNSKNKGDKPNSTSELGRLSPDMMDTVMKLAPILSSMNNDDKYTGFLRSLRPLLSESRQKKLDESSKLIKLIQVFPALKNAGII